MSEFDVEGFEPRGIQRPPRGLPGAPLAKEALRVAIVRSSEAWRDRAMPFLTTPLLGPEDVARVRGRVDSAVALGWTIMVGDLGETRRAWTEHVELCADDPDVAGKICMAVYARAGFVPPTELSGFMRLWAAAVSTSRLIPGFMKR